MKGKINKIAIKKNISFNEEKYIVFVKKNRLLYKE
jgi:hypothetical protein